MLKSGEGSEQVTQADPFQKGIPDGQGTSFWPLVRVGLGVAESI